MWLQTLEDNAIDLVVTDPAYSSLEEHRRVGSKPRLHANGWFPSFPNERFSSFFTELFRVVRFRSHVYVFCDQKTLFIVKPIAEEAGFLFRKFLIWDKQKIGMGYSYRSQHELICFFEKPKGRRKKLNNLGISDILSVARLKGKNYFPTQKPVELFKILIQQSSQPGDLIIDPFMGSGSTGVAALGLGRRFQGSDISERAIKTSYERLNQIVTTRE